jgi:putative N6-adenine-specific DNA methylase
MKSRPFNHSIYASDISAQAIRASRKNIQNALLDDVILLSKKDFFDTRPPADGGLLIMNPPYGERIKQERINSYYEKIGNHLKFSYPGFEAWLLSANFDAVKKIGLKPSVKKELVNGNLECRYLKFELFKGKRSDFLSREKP